MQRWSSEWVHVVLQYAGVWLPGWPLWSRGGLWMPWLAAPRPAPRAAAPLALLAQLELVEVQMRPQQAEVLARCWPRRLRHVWLYRTGCDMSACLERPPPGARSLCAGSPPSYSSPPLRQLRRQDLRLAAGWRPRGGWERLHTLILAEARPCVLSLCRSLRRAPALRKLCLDHNRMDSADAERVAAALDAGAGPRGRAALRYLELGYNEIGAAERLLATLAAWPALEYLGLGCNQIDRLPLRPMAALRELVIECNDLGPGAARHIAGLLERGALPRLRVLDMEDNLMRAGEQPELVARLEKRLDEVTLTNGFFV